jgi:cation diffusion facilitator CzcD-associated flavoprotein CzcO
MDPPKKLILLDKTMRKLQTDSAKRASEHASTLASMRIVDARGGWLSQWDRQFSTLGIEFLRSSMAAHTCPCDPQTMRLWAEDWKRRATDMLFIGLGRDDSYHGPYEVPSTTGFRDFCSDQIKRYHLEHAVECAVVNHIEPCVDAAGATMHFEVTMRNGEGVEEVVRAKRVVVAPGSLNTPMVPDWAKEIEPGFPADRMLHTTHLMWRSTLCGGLQPNEKLLIVGAGLTSGHLSLRALQLEGVSVVLVGRRCIQTKQFDLPVQALPHLSLVPR